MYNNYKTTIKPMRQGDNMSLAKVLLSKVIQTKREVKITVPQVPNFIKIDSIYEPITRLTDKEIKQLGRLWTDAFLTKVKTLRGKE